MRDAVAFSIFRAAGVPAPRTTYAELIFSVPGVYQDTSAGIFTIIEDVNKKFLERTLPPGTGLLMKPEGLGGGVHSLGDTWAAYTAKLRPDREATPHEQQRVMEFSTLVSKNDAAIFREKIRSYLDVDEFLRFVAVNAFIANTDSYLTGGHNFYMYLDPRDDKFRFIPWDEDLSLAARPFGGEIRVVRVDGNVMNAMTFNGVTVANGVTMTNGAAPPVPASAPNAAGPDMMRPASANQLLITQLLADPAIAADYRAILQDLAATAFAPAELTKLMDALEAVHAGLGPSPRPFLEGRAATVQQLVAGWVK
jgi:spore coat protein CotH